jgi:hypothetical protein
VHRPRSAGRVQDDDFHVVLTQFLDDAVSFLDKEWSALAPHILVRWLVAGDGVWKADELSGFEVILVQSEPYMIA